MKAFTAQYIYDKTAAEKLCYSMPALKHIYCLMCGIAGFLGGNYSVAERKRIAAGMKNKLKRRGPNQNGIFISPKAVLVHTRLAVVDIERGRQPMALRSNGIHGATRKEMTLRRSNREETQREMTLRIDGFRIKAERESPGTDAATRKEMMLQSNGVREAARQEMRQGGKAVSAGRDLTLVYNGELYNTEEVRAELLARGHKFSGTGDTEVVLHAFAEFGEKCVAKFNGIFAFAVWDGQADKLFIARDRMGVKPFFYFHDGTQFIFGSDIPTVLTHPAVPHEMDRNGILELILTGPGRTIGNGIFKNVFELKPAECGWVEIKAGGIAALKIKRYWRLEKKPYTKSYEQAVKDVRALVLDTVTRQLTSDVPVGTFLSGGVDSSIITGIAGRQIKNLETFSVDYKDNNKYFKVNKFQPSDDRYYINKMNSFTGANGNRSIIGTAALVKSLYAAVDARGLPGMADVDGSLLLFCRDIKKKVTVALSGECADELFGGYPWFKDSQIDGFPWADNVNYRSGFLRRRVLSGIDVKNFITKKIGSENKTDDECKRAMTRLNTDWFMQTLLERKDRMSMYNGLEVRVPFCDYRLAELVFNLPWEYKNRNGIEKAVLRDAFRDILPEEIFMRKKSPYPKTCNPKYLETVSNKLKAIIADRNAPIHKVIKTRALRGLLKSRNDTPWYGQLMTVPQTIAYFIQFNYWLEKFAVNISL
jgi:asparagine synthase (glutamine-hydrolysing)